MARVSQSFASTINKWRVMVAGFEKHRAALPFAEEDAELLRRLLHEEEELNNRQEQMKTELAKLTEEINSKLKEGRKKYASIMRFAKAKYGPASLEIKDFVPKGER